MRRRLTWRALGAFVPLDLLLRLLVWAGYRHMLGPLPPGAGDRLDRLAAESAPPFVIASVLGLVALLAPIERWLADGRTARADGDDSPRTDLLLRACAAASSAPRRFALVWMASWAIPFALVSAIVLRDSEPLPLGPDTWFGVLLMMSALPLACMSLSFTFLSWFLGDTTGQLSLAAHARGVSLARQTWSIRHRCTVVAICLGLAPALWISSVSFTSSARETDTRNAVEVQLAAHVLADQIAGGDPEALSRAAGGFVADRSGRVLEGRGGAILAGQPVLAAWLTRTASAPEGWMTEPRTDWSIAFQAIDRNRVVGSVGRPDGRHQSQLAILVFFCAVVALYAILCAGFLAGSIGTPIASISRVIRDISERGDVTAVQPIPVFQRDDVGELIEGVNLMLDRLQETARASRTAEASLRHANDALEHRVSERTAELARSNQIIEASLVELRATQRNLVQASRRSGMAEVATAVLHNVGNVMTSVNVSVEVAAEMVHASRAGKLADVARLLDEKRHELPRFLVEDERGRSLPRYLGLLADAMATERDAIGLEISRLRSNLDHIAAIISAQQTLARGGALAVEEVAPAALMEDAIQIGLDRHRGEIELVRDIEDLPPVTIDRHMAVQILINLLRNAQDAVDGVARPCIRVSARALGQDRFSLSVADNGSGIAAEDLTRIFNYGFTTKPNGHGFGLHSSACSARVMGGALRVESPGRGGGASFTLELPTRSLASDPEKSAA